jgi:hypothetical protein
MNLTYDKIKEAVLAKGYNWFENSSYNLNIVGVRNSDTNDEVTNKFDDKITLSYLIDNDRHFHEFDCTTDPGKHWVENVMNDDGVAILVPGQYRGSHQIGLHQGRYEALRQQKPVKVYRDNNLDECYDFDESSIQEGIFGINIHRATKYAGKKSTQIDKWSAGCQVIASYNDFMHFMQICNNAKSIWGNSFTYTLIESKDL